MKKSKKSLSHFSQTISDKGLNTVKGGENPTVRRAESTAKSDTEYIILLIL